MLGSRVLVMSARPGKVRRVLHVPLARPRDRTSAEFVALRRELLGELPVSKPQPAEEARHEARSD